MKQFFAFNWYTDFHQFNQMMGRGRMSERLNFKRFFRFHDRIKPGAYPNTWPLEEKFKIHTCTIQPHYLMHCICNWHLLVWCTKHRQGIFDSSIAHIKTINSPEEMIRLPEDLRPIKSSIRRGLPRSGQNHSQPWRRTAGGRTGGTATLSNRKSTG
jgi:hypothetical protein